MSNVYYNPEDFGLTLIKAHDAAGGYEFDIVVVFEKDGQFFVARDAGCSCPTPFEGTKIPDLTPVRSLGEVDKFAREQWDWMAGGPDGEFSECDKAVAALMDGLSLTRPS